MAGVYIAPGKWVDFEQVEDSLSAVNHRLSLINSEVEACAHITTDELVKKSLERAWDFLSEAMSEIEWLRSMVDTKVYLP